MGPGTRLANRTALITGAGGPMGRAVAKRFAQEGAKLVLGEISANRLGQSVEEITAEVPGVQIASLRGDVTNGGEAAALVQTGLEKFGHIDLLINVVGGIKSSVMSEPFLNISEERWNATFNLNLMANFHLIKLTVPAMLKAGYGRIINVSSINFAGAEGQADYGAAKAAVASLTRSLAIEFAPAVTVNCISPATINTSVVQRMPEEEKRLYRDKTVLKRFGEPLDIANAMLFLASEEAGYITGENLPVSGGVWPAL
ncbi:SDR family NAD(P)-dependent oxidoreductase [Ferrovibrio sp.]|uniref:SDR family NAD(P)-dependent oxidoreductase n=1 Tax=Ferrovibrio sp. TaxID=1917215 RepID=UPI0035AE8F27